MNSESSEYGRAVLLRVSASCRRHVLQELVELRRRAADYLRLAGAGAAQVSMTRVKARFVVIRNVSLRTIMARLRGVRNRSQSRMARGSGDHHVMG